MLIEINLKQFLTLNDLVFKQEILDYGKKEDVIDSLKTMFSRDKIFSFDNKEAESIRSYISKKIWKNNNYTWEEIKWKKL